MHISVDVMAVEIKVPALGESVTEATVGQWFKKPGDTVAADEPVVEIETDKVIVEVAAPTAGVLSDIKVPQGTTVAIGAILGSIEPPVKPAKTPASRTPAASQPAPTPSRTLMGGPSPKVTPERRGEAGKIFINYRRGDDPGFTHALFQRLEHDFTPGDLFFDVGGSIKPGDDFVDALTEQVAECAVLLAVIGPRWVDLLAARAEDAEDFVAIEIKAALDQNKRVVPVLVGGASMPRSDELPESIRKLARRNAVELRPQRFKSDCDALVQALKAQLARTTVDEPT